MVEITADGGAFETATIGRESATAMVEAILQTPVATRVFAQISGSAISLSAQVFRARAAESPDLMRLVLRHLHAITRQAEIGVACNLAHGAEARLARWLLMTEDRTGGPTFDLTQESMAVMTGVQRTTISGIAAALKADGLIDYQRGAVVIRDQAGLKARACACYPILEAQFQGLRKPVA